LSVQIGAALFFCIVVVPMCFALQFDLLMDAWKWLRSQMQPSKPHKGVPFLLSGIGITAAYLSRRYGMHWLAWIAAAVLWWAVVEFTKAIKSPAVRNALRITADLPPIFSPKIMRLSPVLGSATLHL
jgi:hypothetical protein